MKNEKKTNNFALVIWGCCVALLFSALYAAGAERASYEPGKVLVKFDPGILPSGTATGIEAIDSLLSLFGAQSSNRALTYATPGSDLYDRWWALHFPEDAPVQEIVKKLRDTPGISYAEVSHIIYPASTPSDACYSSQWSLPMMNVPAGWNRFPGIPGSSAVTVAVIDSGINTTHNEFDNPTNRLISGYNFVNNNTDVTDQCGHGTKCAGMVGANWNGFQMAGMDAQCKIRPVKIFGTNCSSNPEDVPNGILWAKDPHDGYQANVLSLSFGYQLTESDTCTAGLLHDAILEARAAGCIIVVAAHNHGIGKADLYAPACFAEVITVGSIDDNYNRSIWHAWTGFWESSTGEAVDVVAPAGRGCTTANHPAEMCMEESTEVWVPAVNYSDPASSSCSTFSGTSAATPQVAGICALLKAKSSTLTHDQAQCLLARHAHDQIGPPAEDLPGKDDSYGWGLVDLDASIQGITGPTPSEPQLLSPGVNTENHPWNEVMLDWQDSTNPGTYDYSVWREDTMALVASGQGLYYTEATVRGLLPGHWYRWQIRAKHCMETSESESAVWRFKTLDSPYIVFDSVQQPIELGGDHDTYLESGEIWELEVKLRNEGTMEASTVTATLDADVGAADAMEPFIYYNAAADFGTIPVGLTATRSYIFRIDPAAWDGSPFKCGDIVHLNLVSKSATGGGDSFDFPDDLDFYEPPEGLPVGLSTESETAYAPPISSFSTGSRTTVFVPDFNINDDPQGFISISGRLSIPLRGTWGEILKDCAKIELKYGSQLLSPPVKDYGEDASASYNITSYYQTHLAGTYSAVVSECPFQTGCGSSSCSGTISTLLGSMTVTKEYTDMCETYDASIAVTPAQGTAAGGTWVDVYGPVGTFESGLTADLVKFGFNNDCPVSNTMDSEAVQFISDNHIRVLTPIAPAEDTAALYVDNPTLTDQCLPNAYDFKTLAYTANQVTQDISVVDTVDNGLFAPKESMGMGPTVVPMNMAFNQASAEFTEPGRVLYLVDYASGNLEVFDVANFTPMDMDSDTPGVQSRVELQDPSVPLAQPGAFDIAISRDGCTMFASHITSGEWGPYSNPVPGGISVLSLDSKGIPVLIDVDDNPDTSSPGARVSRLWVQAVENGPLPVQHNFYPLSLKTVMITDDTLTYPYSNNEKYPGEYIFVSGLGFSAPSIPFPCPPKQYCMLAFQDRPAMVAIIDNNEWKCVDTNKDHICESYSENPDYWKNNGYTSYKVIGGGIDGIDLGQTSNSLGFSRTSGSPLSSRADMGPTVYMLNETEAKAYLFNYDQSVGEWSLVMNPDRSLEPFTIPTGLHPTDVKVQRVPDIDNPGSYVTRAYITNAGEDTVTVVDTATNASTGAFTLKQLGYSEILYPACFDTRNIGDKGFSANFEDGTVSTLQLTDNQVLQMIDVGEAPIRIVVQPVPGAETSFAQVRNELAFAEPTDFTTPSKQSNLIRDWEDVHILQTTSANPQAVLSNINAFKTKVASWIASPALKVIVTKGVNLYRSAYLYNNPTLRQ